jgi:glycosyltransferase involved in cell wall biosynthesis
MTRICYFGTYRDYYPRNTVHLRALRSAGMEVLECHRPLLPATFDKTDSLFRPLALARTVLAAAATYALLTIRYLLVKPHDIIMVGYIGHWDVLVAKVLALLFGRTLVFDAFVSIHDSVVNDRRLLTPSSWKARLLFGLERFVYRLCDLILMDTHEHARYLSDTFAIPLDRIAVIPLGVDEDVFFPKAAEWPSSCFTVLHYSYCAPLHGSLFVVDAAAALADRPDIRFQLVGDGQQRREAQRVASARGLSSVAFTQIVPPQELAQRIAQADVCLGVFGTSEKVGRVIPNKVLQAMAMKKPVVTARSAAVERYFTDKIHLLYCEAGSGAAIAAAVVALKDDPALRESLAAEGHRRWRELFSGASVKAALEKALLGFSAPS